MPDFKNKLVVVDDKQPKALAPELTLEQKAQKGDKIISDLQTKVQTGKATKKDIDLYNYHVNLNNQYIKEVDKVQAQADNFAPKAIKLFNEDFSTLKAFKAQDFIPTSAVTFFTDVKKLENQVKAEYDQGKAAYQQKAIKELSKVQDYYKTGNSAKLRELAKYLEGPQETKGFLSPESFGYKQEGSDTFYQKGVFETNSKKTSAYLINLANVIDTKKMLYDPEDFRAPMTKRFADSKNKLSDIKNNPDFLKEIGRELYSQQVGSELYGEDKMLIHAVRSQDNPDNKIDYKAMQLAMSTLNELAKVESREKLAQYKRLELHYKETVNPKDLPDVDSNIESARKLYKDIKLGKTMDKMTPQEQLVAKKYITPGLKAVVDAEESFSNAEKTAQEINSYDLNKALKKDFKSVFFEQEEEKERDAYMKYVAPSMGVFEMPIKGGAAVVAGFKSLYNNLLSEGAGYFSMFGGDFDAAENSYIVDTQKIDKVGYTLGIDESGNPVESNKFRWTDSKGKTHYNGYAIIESGMPVAYQMVEAMAVGAAIGTVGSAVGTGLSRGASNLGKLLIGEQRLASAGKAISKIPGSASVGELLNNKEVYNRLNTFASVYTTTYPRIYMEEFNNFKNSEDAQKVARLRAAVESISESYVPNTPDLFKSGAKGIFSTAKKQAVRDLSAGLDGVVLGMFPGASKKVVKAISNSAITKRALGMAGDVFQEGVIEEEASLLGNYFVDSYAKSKNEEYIAQNDLTFKNIIDTAVESTAAMLLTAPFMGGGSKRSDNEAILSARWNIANNPDLYKSLVGARLKAQEITEEKAVQDIAKIDQYAQALENLPISDLSSIRDMETLLEDKDAQYEFFSNYLQKEKLLEYTPTEAELPEYKKELARLDVELYKTQELANKFDSLSVADKKQIIQKNFAKKLNELTQQDDFSPAAVTVSLAQATKDLAQNKNRLFSTELEGYIKGIEASMELAKEKFQNFIVNNNTGLTSEQRRYKASLVHGNKEFYPQENVDAMFEALTQAEIGAYLPLFSIENEDEFVEALSKNYVTAYTNKRPLTSNGKVLFNTIQEEYINDSLFDKFVQGLPEEEAAKKKEELKNRFWTRVVELKQNQEPGQIFPEVNTTPETPSQKTAKEGQVPTTYKDSVQKFREAAERGMSEDMGMIRDEIVTQLTSEPTIESLTEALVGVKNVFIETDLDKVISDLQQNKTESLVEFLEEAGATPKEISSIVSNLPKAEEKATKTQETKETKTAEDIKADIERRRVDIISRKSTPQEKFEFLESIPEGTIFKNEDDEALIVRKKITKRGTESYELVPLFLNEDNVWEKNTGAVSITEKKANGEFNVNATLPQIFTSKVEIILPTDANYDTELAVLEGKSPTLEFLVTGTEDGFKVLLGEELPGYQDHRSDPEFQNSGGEFTTYFKEQTLGDKKVFTIVDTGIKDAFNRRGYIATSIVVDKDSALTSEEAQAILQEKHAKVIEVGTTVKKSTLKGYHGQINAEALKNLDLQEAALESMPLEDFLSSEEATTLEALETISTEEFVAIQEKQTEEEREAEEAYEKQLSAKQETIQSNVIEDVRENYVYLGITDTNYKDETRLTDENTAFLFSVVDNIDNSINSADMRSLGYNLVLHTGRDILNRLSISIEPKETYEEFKEQFRVNGILILGEDSIKYLQRAASNIDSIKLALMTNELGEPLFFDKTGERVEEGTPFVSLIGQTWGPGKELDNKFRASMPSNAQIVPLSKFVNGRAIVKKPLTAKESNDLIIHLEKQETVDTGGKPFTLYPGVVYLKTNNPKFPYRSTYQRQNTPETAEEVMTLIEAYNESKLNPEESTLPEYFSAMSPANFIKYIHNYAFIPKNSTKYKWGITLVRKEGENAATLIRIYNNNDKSNIISREEAVNLIASTNANSSRDFFNGDLVFRPFYIEEGKVKVEKAINFKSWLGNFAKSGARVDGVANRNLAFAKQDVKELSGKPTTEAVKPALTDEQIVSMFTAEPTVEAPAPVVTDARVDIEKNRQEELKNNNGSIVKNEVYSIPILRDNRAKVRGDIQRYVTKEIVEKAYNNDDREGANYQTLDTLIRRGAYSIEELNDLLPNWKELLPSTQEINAKYDAELDALKEAKPTEAVVDKAQLEAERDALIAPLQKELDELTAQLADIETSNVERALDKVIEENATEEELEAVAAEENISKEEAKERVKEELNNSINNVKPSTPLGEALKKLINKILKAFLVSGLIVSLNFSNLAFAPGIYRPVKAVSKQISVTQKKDASYNELTEDGKLAYDSEVASGKSFVIVDKPLAKAFIYNNQGGLIKSFPVLLGAAVGDLTNDLDANLDIAPDAKKFTTPGKYTLSSRSKSPSTYKNKILSFKNGGGLAIHIVYPGELEKRTQALNTPSIEDNRLSWGCVNVDEKNWDAYIKGNITAGSTIIITRDNQVPATQKAVEKTAKKSTEKRSEKQAALPLVAGLAMLLQRRRRGENVDAEIETFKESILNRINTLNEEILSIQNQYDERIKSLTPSETAIPEVTFRESQGKIANDLKDQYKGKLIYATPGAGKTTLSLGMQGVIDSDELMIAEMQKRHPEFLGKPGESIQEFIFRYVKIHDHKSEINDIVLGKIKQLTAQGYTVLTGTTAFIKDSDFAFTLPLTNPRILTRFGNEQTAKTFSGKEAEEIRKSGKTSEVLNDNLEFFLTKKGYTDSVPVESPVPTRRGTRGKGGKIELNRAKEYRNQITELQNKIAEEWVNTVGKKMFGADRFIFEQTLINPEAYATWSPAAIRLFADANFADAYHESWHEFTQMYLTSEQRETLYKEGRKIYGEKLTNLEIEEKFAEDFRQFMLTGVMPEAVTQYKESKTILQKIADFLRNFFTNKQTVDRYFERLAKGKVGSKVSKPEFVTLNSAKALYLTNENNELAPLSFQESKRYLDMVDELFVMLGNNIVLEAAAEEVKENPDALKGLSYLNLMYTPSNIELVYDEIYSYLAALEEEAIEKNDVVAMEEFSRIFGLQGENAELIFNYHKQNSSLFTPEMVEELTDLQDVEDEELSDTNLIKSELGAKSQKEIAPPIVINIIRSIPKVDKDGEVIENSLTGASIFGDFTENWNILTNVLSGSTNYDEMLQRINDLSVEYPQFGYLLQRLPEKINRDSDQQLRNLFFNTLSMEKVDGVIGTFNDKGQFTVNNTSTLDTKRIRDAWSLMFSTEKGKPFKKPSAVTGNFVLDPRLFDAYPKEPETAEDVLAFLQAIGFNYSQKAQEAFLKDFNKVKTKFHYVYEKLKEVTLYSTVEVANPFLAIRENHTNASTGQTVKGKGYDLDYLIEIEAKNNLAFANDMIQLADNTNQFITTPHTYQTKVIAALNDPKYKYFEDLIADYPELDPSKNVGLEGSAYLEYLFDFTTDVTVQGKIKHKRNFKNGKPVTIEIVSMNGVKAPEDTEYIFNKKTIDLEDPEKHLGDIRTLLSPFGRVEENNRIGDKSTTRGTYLSSEDYFLYNKDFYYQNEKLSLSPEIWNIFYNYLKAEASVTDRTSFSKTFNDNKFFEEVPQLAYFSEILSPELRSDIYKFFQNNTVEDFESSPLRNSVKKEMNSWFYSLAESSEELLSKFDSAEKTDYQVSKQELFMYHVLSMISRIEQYKLFNFHPYYYKNAKDVEKRISAFNAAGNYAVVDKANLDYTENTLTGRVAFEKYAKARQIEVLPREGTNEDITYLVFKDTAVDSTTAKDNKEDYGIHYDSYVNTKADVQDAASIITLDFFQKFYSMSTGLSLEMKKELDRQNTIWTNMLELKVNSKNQEARENLLKALNEGPHYIFSVKKLQYAGPGYLPAEVVPVFHKYSNKVMLPSEMVDNEEMFQIGVKLYASNADYGVFKTGTKIAETVEPVALFDKGKVIPTGKKAGVISLKYLKEQQEVEHKKDFLIIFATQFRKLLFKDITTQEEKDLFDVFKAYLGQLTNYDKAKFLDKIEDKEKAVEFLVEQLDKKNVSSITKDLIRLKEDNKELEYAIDSLIERTAAESAITSAIRKSIVRQKFNGTQFVQFPVSLVRPDKQLKFYRIEDDKIASAECIISFSRKYYPLLNLPFDKNSTIGKFDKDGNIINRYQALRRLNQKLADESFRKKYEDSLTLAGVRIPVQGYNSMEKMQIVEFLPEESGSVMLVPDELVVKSGGDFDIDKLFMYEPILNKNTGLMLTDENSSKGRLAKLPNKGLLKTKEELEREAQLTKLSVEEYMKKTGFVLGEESEVKAARNLQERLEREAVREERSLIQNKLLDTIKKRLSQKQIFEDLIEPNNVKDLDKFAKVAPDYLQGDVNKIAKEPSTGRNMWSNIINPLYQLYVYQLAHAVDMVGIAAKMNVFQTSVQDAKLEIVNKRDIDLIFFDTHKNAEGNIELWKIYDIDNVNKISQIISQFISGSVDVVKNDNILKNNVNPNTVSVALYLSLMGVRYKDINSFLTDELIYMYSKGQSFESLLQTYYPEQYKEFKVLSKSGKFSNYDTAVGILETSGATKETILTDSDLELARLAQFIILENQQSNYITPLVTGVDYDTQSFQNFENITEIERNVKKVYESGFFNQEAVAKLVNSSTVSSFRVSADFIRRFEDMFPISANKGLTDFMLNSYVGIRKSRISYENYSRRFKNALLTSMLESNMSEFAEYANYLRVDPTVKNIEDMLNEIKKEAAEYGASIPLIDSIFFTGNLNSDYISPGILKNNNDIDVNAKKEEFMQGLAWDTNKVEDVPEQFRNKVRNFFRIFAYTGIISTQLNKAHGSFLEIIPEEIYTPVVDKYVKALSEDISLGTKSSYLVKFNARFKYNNPDIFARVPRNMMINPSLKFYRNYNLSIPEEEVSLEYKPIVERPRVERITTTTTTTTTILPASPANEISNPVPGVENIPDSGLTIEQSNNFIDLLQPQILNQAYIENKAKTANMMFSFGLRWAKNIPNQSEKSEQAKDLGKPRPNRKQIKSKEGMTYGYYLTDQNNKPLPSMDKLQPIIDFIESKLGIDMSNYDAMLGNIYDEYSFIHQHRDTTESVTAEKYPVIVINLGADGHLEFDKDFTSTYATYNKSGQLNLTNGGIYAFGVNGENRFTFHHRIGSGLESKNPLKPITLPNGKTLTNYRITLTFRRASDLEPGMPNTPSRTTQQVSKTPTFTEQQYKDVKVLSDTDVTAFNTYLSKSGGKSPAEFFTSATTFKEFYNPSTNKREKAPQSSKWMLQGNGLYDLVDKESGEVYISNVDLKSGMKKVPLETKPVEPTTTLKENLPAVEPPSLKEQLSTLEAERKELLEIQKESAPYIPELIIADNLPKIQTESAKKETGLNVGTKQDINPSLISTDGMTVEKAAEYLQQDYFNGVQYQKMDLQDIRNAIIEILSMGKAAFVQTNTPLTSELEDVNQEIARVKAEIEVEAKSEELDPNKGGIPVDTLTRQLSIDFNSFESQSSDPEIDKKIINEANNLSNDESLCNTE